MTPPTPALMKGLFWAATAILVWSGSLVMLRLGVTTSLNVYDLTAVRFGVSAVVLAPVALRHRMGLSVLGTGGFITMVGGFGAPYILLMSTALQTAPAAAAGALNPGVMAIGAVLMGWLLFRDPVGPLRICGMALILSGGGLISMHSGSFEIGHLILIGTGFMWCAYTMTVRWKAVPALQATAYVAVWSAILFLPVYILLLPKQIGEAPLIHILGQAIFQGLLVGIAAVFAFNRSAELLGPIAGSTLPALIPLVSLILGAFFLGEEAGMGQLGSAILIGAGVAMILAGGRWRRTGQTSAPRRRREALSSEKRSAPKRVAVPK